MYMVFIKKQEQTEHPIYVGVVLQLMWHLEGIQKAIDTLKC